MHNFLIHLLEKKEEPFEIAFLNVFHILYFAIILAFSIGLAFYIRKHSDKTESVLRALTYSLIVVYVADIFLQHVVGIKYRYGAAEGCEFFRTENENGRNSCCFQL